MLHSSLDKVVSHIESSVESYVAAIGDVPYFGNGQRYDAKEVDRKIFPYIDITKHLNGDVELYSIDAKKLCILQSFASRLQESYERNFLDKDFDRIKTETKMAKSDDIKYGAAISIAFFGTTVLTTYLLATKSDSNYMNDAAYIFVGGIAGFFAIIAEQFSGVIYNVLNIRRKSKILGTKVYEEKLKKDTLEKLQA